MRGRHLYLLTTEAQPATGSAAWFQRMGALPWFPWRDRLLRSRGAEVGVFGARGSYPAGTAHAAEEGRAQALCGAQVAFRWWGRFEPARLRRTNIEVCPLCEEDVLS